MYGMLVHHNKTIPVGDRMPRQEVVELTFEPHGS